MARRRKPLVQWLPHVTHNDQDAGIGNWQGTVIVQATSNAFKTGLYSLVPDYPAEAIRATGGQTPSLGDFEGSAYRLRRIVGKLFVGMSNAIGAAPPLDTPIASLVGAGFIVLRVAPLTGAPLLAGTPDAYNPLINDSTRDPWIWRRTWILQNDFAVPSPGAVDTWQFPRTNCEYGSIQDGPHIDAKTARRIEDEARLFFVIGTQNISGNATLAGTIRFLLDYRILASALRSAGNRRNATR